MQTHIINKQIFEFNCQQSEHAFQMQAKMDDGLQSKIKNTIDHICSELISGSENLRMDHLEIDLGNIQFQRLEAEILQVFEKKFRTKLSQLVNELRIKNAKPVQQSENYIQILKSFLSGGNLPWYAGTPQLSFISDLINTLLIEPGQALRSMLLQNFFNQPFIERLIYHASAEALEKILALISIEGSFVITLENILRPFFQDEKVVAFNSSLEKVARILTLRILSSDISSFSDVEFKSQVLQFFAETIERNEIIITSRWNISDAQLVTLQEEIHSQQERIREEQHLLLQQDKEGIDVIAEKRFFIGNAGVVLLAPFLPELFTNLKLLDEGKFLENDKQLRALFLLHYLCTGETAAPEYALPLNKILCGVPIDEAIPSSVPIQENEKEECDQLLRAVIFHWEKLKNISIESFRESFLIREGILSIKETDWLLQVERKSYDLLLDSLPWSFQNVKLQWMENLIITEW